MLKKSILLLILLFSIGFSNVYAQEIEKLTGAESIIKIAKDAVDSRNAYETAKNNAAEALKIYNEINSKDEKIDGDSPEEKKAFIKSVDANKIAAEAGLKAIEAKELNGNNDTDSKYNNTLIENGTPQQIIEGSEGIKNLSSKKLKEAQTKLNNTKKEEIKVSLIKKTIDANKKVTAKLKTDLGNAKNSKISDLIECSSEDCKEKINQNIDKLNKDLIASEEKSKKLGTDYEEAKEKLNIANAISTDLDIAILKENVEKDTMNYNTSLIENGNLKQQVQGMSNITQEYQQQANEACKSPDSPDCKIANDALEELKAETKNLKNKYDDSEGAEGDIASRGFQISVNDISPGLKVKKDSTINENINFVLGTIIQKLMIALGSFALLIMTVGAGYVVLHNGQDELLSKGKAIFMSGVYSLVVALGSYYIIAIVRYILYF